MQLYCLFKGLEMKGHCQCLHSPGICYRQLIRNSLFCLAFPFPLRKIPWEANRQTIPRHLAGPLPKLPPDDVRNPSFRWPTVPWLRPWTTSHQAAHPAPFPGYREKNCHRIIIMNHRRWRTCLTGFTGTVVVGVLCCWASFLVFRLLRNIIIKYLNGVIFRPWKRE